MNIYACIIKIHVPRAHDVKNQRVIAKRTSQIMKYGQDVIIQKWTDDNIPKSIPKTSYKNRISSKVIVKLQSDHAEQLYGNSIYIQLLKI